MNSLQKHNVNRISDKENRITNIDKNPKNWVGTKFSDLRKLLFQFSSRSENQKI